MTVATDGIVRAFNRSGTTKVVALDIPKILDGVWHAGLLHKFNSYGMSGRVSILILYFSVVDGVRGFWIVFARVSLNTDDDEVFLQNG